MEPILARYFFDYVDPVSFVVEEWLRAAERELGVRVARHPLEVVPPPGPLLDPDAPAWRERWAAARERHPEPLVRPGLVPWTRKAHELVLQAAESGRPTPEPGGPRPPSGAQDAASDLQDAASDLEDAASDLRDATSDLRDAVHLAIFRSYHLQGRDIGRVDVLADIGARAGMDPADVRIALGVDRHVETLEDLRREAERLGVAGVPTLLAGDRRLEGPADARQVLAFLRETAP